MLAANNNYLNISVVANLPPIVPKDVSNLIKPPTNTAALMRPNPTNNKPKSPFLTNPTWVPPGSGILVTHVS